MNISAVIPTNFKRNNLNIIVNSLVDAGFEDIIIEYNNNKLYGRYEGMKKAKYDIIYTQDDDCLIHNIPELVKSYNKNLIVNNITKERSNYYKENYPEITLIGWGAIFNKSIINIFDSYIKKYGIDDLLKIEADRVFTFFNENKEIISDNVIEHLGGYMNGISNELDHFDRLELIYKRLKSL